jgi:hypothetical protein
MASLVLAGPAVLHETRTLPRHPVQRRSRVSVFTVVRIDSGTRHYRFFGDLRGLVRRRVPKTNADSAGNIHFSSVAMSTAPGPP